MRKNPMLISSFPWPVRACMEVQKKQPFDNFMPKRTDIKKILIIGSGPIVIGQACEFDYSGTQACKALREEGYQVVLVNSNPATIMTDPEFADVTYIEPLTVDCLEKIIAKERPRRTAPHPRRADGLESLDGYERCRHP